MKKISLSLINRGRVQLYLTAFLQVMFVAANTVFIAKALVTEMLITSFCLSFVWTLNIKKVAFGNWIDRVIYAAGACTGTGVGFLLANHLVKIL